MTDEKTRAAEIDKAVKASDAAKADAAAATAKADAEAGEKLDLLLSYLDSMNKRLDAYEAADAAAKADAAKKAADDDGDDVDDPDKRPVKQDGTRKMRDMEMDSMRADAEEIATFKAEVGSQYDIRPESVKNAIFRDAERAAGSWGNEPLKPYEMESVTSYRRRAARQHQQHSPAWAKVNLDDLSGQSLRVATAQIYADSIAASRSPAAADEGFLREVVQRDPNTGHIVRTYFGEPRSWLSFFSGGRPRLARFRFGSDRDRDS